MRRRIEAKAWPEAAQEALTECTKKSFQRPKDIGSRKSPSLRICGKIKLSVFLFHFMF